MILTLRLHLSNVLVVSLLLFRNVLNVLNVENTWHNVQHVTVATFEASSEERAFSVDCTQMSDCLLSLKNMELDDSDASSKPKQDKNDSSVYGVIDDADSERKEILNNLRDR